VFSLLFVLSYTSNLRVALLDPVLEQPIDTTADVIARGQKVYLFDYNISSDNGNQSGMYSFV
jgi:hypothetical protein